ncbi:TPA: RHS repeat domain-containing protein, partial [Vibrio cholerae]
SQLHYIVTDHSGTPQELCSENGDVVWQGEQALWGHYQQRNALPNHGFRENAQNDELYCDLRYQGQIEDRESGLYYNVNRYYDADSGQYLSPDPIGFAGGLRPQAYVFNPLDWVDPLGLAGEAHEGKGETKKKKSGVPNDDFVPSPDVTEKYTRPSKAGPTKAQKASVQGKPCVDCGAITPKQVADHKDPLVVQHYREGSVNIQQQRQIDAVQPHCPSCSNVQGGQLGVFGKKMKEYLRL